MGRSQDNTQNLNCGQLQTEDFFKNGGFFFKSKLLFFSTPRTRKEIGRGVKKKKGGT